MSLKSARRKIKVLLHLVASEYLFILVGCEMRRREFVGLIGGAAAWPLAAGAQQVKRVAVLMVAAATDPAAQANLATFVQGLRKLGWIEGQNLQLEVRWSAGDVNVAQAYATDLVG